MTGAGAAVRVPVGTAFAREQNAAAPPSFTFTNVNVPNASSTSILGFAPDGSVVGSFYDASDNVHGFIENKAGQFKQVDLTGIAGLVGTTLQAMTAAGTLAQAYVNTTKGQIVESYFISPAGKYTQLSVPNAKSTTARSMNASGTIVGSFLAADGVTTEAFVYMAGSYTMFRKPGTAYTSYNGINNDGVIAGDYQVQPGPDPEVGFILNGSAMKLVEHPGVTETILQGINDAGAVVGYVRDYYNRSNTGFVYKAGAFTNVAVGSLDNVSVTAIDGKGDIAGSDVPVYTATSGFVGTLK